MVYLNLVTLLATKITIVNIPTYKITTNGPCSMSSLSIKECKTEHTRFIFLKMINNFCFYLELKREKCSFCII